jgi:hypothetical protein
MTAMPASVRNLFRAALVTFVITVVIGILNGLDIWDPPRGALLTHVHAGTLGWITLAVFGGAIWMFGDEEGGADGLAIFSIFSLSAYVLAFWSVDLTSPTTIQRPIGGTLAFIAMAWMMVWAFRRKRGRVWTVPQFGMALALVFLVIGAVLGVLLGLQLADVEIVTPENAEKLAGAHPAAMVFGFVVLAALALAEWMLRGDDAPLLGGDRLGAIQMISMFLAGLSAMLGVLFTIEPLLMLNVPLEVVAIGLVLWRLRRHLGPSQWGAGPARFVRTSLIALVPVVVLTAMVIQQFVSGADFPDFVHILVALDHTNFLLVVTGLILAMMIAGSAVSGVSSAVMYYGLVVGASGFIVGLLAQSTVLKRIFTPILGLALLHAIFTLLIADRAERVPEKV